MSNFNERYLEKKNNEILTLVQEHADSLLMESIADYSNSPHFETIERAIDQIQQHHDVELNLLKIKKAINAEFKTNCMKIFITTNNVHGDFFGAQIIPTEKECYRIIDNLVKTDKNIKFEHCSEFVIELDSKLVYDLKATPEEIVAVILHEIGHKVFYSNHKTRMKARFIEQLAANGLLLNSAIKLGGIFSYKFLLITLVISGFTSCFNNVLSLKDEIDSDSFAIKCGYGVHLHTVMTKIIDNTKMFGVVRIGRNKQKEEVAITAWCVNSMVGFLLRRKEIRRDLEMMKRSERNPEVVKLIDAQIKAIDSTKVNKKGLNKVNFNGLGGLGSVTKSESFSSFAEMNVKGISYLELDEIHVEIDRIRDPEDKLYVMSRIHKNLADNGKFIQRKQKELEKKRLTDEQIRNNKEMQELMAYRKQLLDLLQRCRNTKPRERYHHYIVGYPVGYEG